MLRGARAAGSQHDVAPWSTLYNSQVRILLAAAAGASATHGGPNGQGLTPPPAVGQAASSLVPLLQAASLVLRDGLDERSATVIVTKLNFPDQPQNF